MASEMLTRYIAHREELSHLGALRRLTDETTIDYDTLERVLKRAAGVERMDWFKLRHDSGRPYRKARAASSGRTPEVVATTSPPAPLGAMAQALARAGMEVETPAFVEGEGETCGYGPCPKILPPGRTYCTAKHGRAAKKAKARHLRRQQERTTA